MLEVGKFHKIYVGRQGENLVNQLEVDVSKWVSEYPGGTITMILKRPGESTVYIASDTVVSGVLKYTFTNYDTQIVGCGRGEFRVTKNNQIKKSAEFRTIIEESVTGAEVTPTPVVPWVDTVIAAKNTAVQSATTAKGYADDAEDYKDAAASSVSKYPKIDSTTGNWLVWNATAGSWSDTGIHAKGDAGDDAPQIDDAHAYATNPWSGQKINTELATKSNSSHLHDDRYYTKGESDSTIATKANIVHTHSISGVTGLSSVLTETTRSLEQLWYLSMGKVWDFETDSNTAYKKIVLSGSKVLDIQKISGRTIVFNQLADQFGSNTTVPLRSGVKIVASHKYYVSGDISGSLYLYIGKGSGVVETISSAKIFTASITRTADGTVNNNANSVWFNRGASSVSNIKLVDLTLMFGQGFEPSTTSEFMSILLSAIPTQYTLSMYSFQTDRIEIRNNSNTLVKTIQVPSGVKSMSGYGMSCNQTANTVEKDSDDNWWFVQRVASRGYLPGDENDQTVLTDTIYTIYVIPTPVSTNITSYMSVFEPIDCDTGWSGTFVSHGVDGAGTGSITENDAHMPVQSTEQYLIKLGDVIQ